MSAVLQERKSMIKKEIAIIKETASEEDEGTTRRNVPKYKTAKNSS